MRKVYVNCNGAKLCRTVRNNKEGEKYILLQNKHVPLNTIRGKYRYVHNGGNDDFLATSISMMMDEDGDIKAYHTNAKYDVNGTQVPFFRKTLNIVHSYNEPIIVSKIQKNTTVDKKNVLIRILNVTDAFYDAELLDVYYRDKSTLMDDVKECLDMLHKLRIVYIDLKLDNIGYSHIDKRWKIFDFDCSGIANTDFSGWLEEPPFYFAYKQAYKEHFKIAPDINTLSIKKVAEIIPLTKIDDIMYSKLTP